MAMTEFGPNHPLAVRLWAKRLFVESLRETFIDRFIGTSDTNAIIQMRDELEASPLATASPSAFVSSWSAPAFLATIRWKATKKPSRRTTTRSSSTSFVTLFVRAARCPSSVFRSAFVRSRWTA
jgi:hypothetical protein